MSVERSEVEDWVRSSVRPVGPLAFVHVRPWATVVRVSLADGVAWFKACAPVQAFEPRLTARLSFRWPDRVAEVLAHDLERGWLLLADAGTPIGVLGNPPRAWLAVLPRYAELQRGEAVHAEDHVDHGVPDLRVASLPAGYDGLLRRDLPLGPAEIARLRRFAPTFSALCDKLAAHGVPATVQHDDLHHNNVYTRDGRARVLDWGDASIGHPFVSLVVTFRFLEDVTGLRPGDPWFDRLRDVYLEPWGSGLTAAFALATRVGAFAHAIACVRQRDALRSESRSGFDTDFVTVLRRALARVDR